MDTVYSVCDVVFDFDVQCSVTHVKDQILQLASHILSKVWAKPHWSKKPVKLCCHQAWELKGSTQRRSEREAGERALKSSPWQEREATCPESGSRLVILSETNWLCPLIIVFWILSSSCSMFRDVTSASPGRREYTVGQYVVDLPAFEALVLPLFRNVSRDHVSGLYGSVDHRKLNTPMSPHLTNHYTFNFLSIDGIIGSQQRHKFQSGIFSVGGAVWLSLTMINTACKWTWGDAYTCTVKNGVCALAAHLPLSCQVVL